MDFVGCSKEETTEMLDKLGLKNLDLLFSEIPQSMRVKVLPFDDGLSEFEVSEKISLLGNKNRFSNLKSYLGAGAEHHYIPACVSSFIEKSEFLTSYTPYQAEISQGVLQALFEFQSAIAILTGLDAASASLYDGASATAEAALLATRIFPDRYRILVADTLHPRYIECLKFYLEAKKDIAFEVFSTKDPSKIHFEGAACIIAASPNVFGIFENLKPTFEKAKETKTLCIQVSHPIAMTLFQSPCEVGADIATGELQPLGIPLEFGGPYAGFIACRKEWLRHLPGRIVGATKDKEGKRGYVLTLQAREQHIRRDKASSNICTNQTLLALASSWTLFWYGKEKVRALALSCYQRAAYLSEQLSQIPQVERFSSDVHFLEFAWRIKGVSTEILTKAFMEKGIFPGFPLEDWYPHLKGFLLTAVTETKNLEDLKAYIKVVNEFSHSL